MEYRSVLEVSKLCEAETLLRSSALVCELWLRVSQCNELWDSLGEAYQLSARKGQSSRDWFRSCYRCSRSIPILSTFGCTCYAVPNLTARMISFSAPKVISINTIYCWLNSSSLICCGGSLNLTTYEISTLAGQITQLADINEERNWAGIIKCQNLIYIIGGSHDDAYRESAEKYDPKLNNWTVLKGQLHKARNGFTPCEYAEKIYCVGRWDSVEVLDLVSELFTKLSVKLPSNDYWSLSVVVDGCLIIVREHSFLQYDLESWTIVRKCTTQTLFHGLWSNCPPVRYGNCFYSVLNGNPQEGILKLDVDRFAVEVAVQFPPSY